MVWYEDILGTLMQSLQAEYIKYPWVLLLIIPLMIFIFILLKKDFVHFKDDKPEQVFARKQIKKTLLFTRLIIFSLLLIALATPYVEQTKTTENEPFVRILIDNSTSMNLLDTSHVSSLITQLKSQINVEDSWR